MESNRDEATTNTIRVWENLCAWIQSNGGRVHSGLELRIIDTGGTTTTSSSHCCHHRGVFATRPIAQGNVLIELPRALSISGDDMPFHYSVPIIQRDGSSGAPGKEDEHQQQNQQQRHASPWLRCLAAYYKARKKEDLERKNTTVTGDKQTISFKSYLDSLPRKYETVSVSWTSEQVDSFLAGTSSAQQSLQQQQQQWNADKNNSSNNNNNNNHGSSTEAGDVNTLITSITTPTRSSSSWQDDPSLVRERYLGQIRPYLIACGILDDALHDLDKELDKFLVATQCLSTRCFHVQTTPTTTDTKTPMDVGGAATAAASTGGPFLLPVIDLLNHSTDPRIKCTTLMQGTTTTAAAVSLNSPFFVMRAERDIRVGEEICHSYGDELTACQSLQTFGFVERSVMEFIMEAKNHSRTGQQQQQQEPQQQHKQQRQIRAPSPALISKRLVLESCWQVIESDLPRRLRQAMEEADMEDEVWDIQVDRSRTADFLPDQLLVERGGRGDVTSLSDELVTLACLPFLPCVRTAKRHDL